MLRQTTLRIMRLMARHAGYEIRSSTPLDLRLKTSNPLEAAYLCRRGSFLINVPIALCRGWFGFDFSSRHPFVRTAKAIIAKPSLEYERSPLPEYYSHFAPITAFAALGVLPGREGDPTAAFPAYAVVYPWECKEPARRAALKEKIARSENEKRGKRLSIHEGVGAFGPVSDNKGRVEFAALSELVRSIQNGGYVRSDAPDGDICGVVAVSDSNQYRFFVSSGHHRASVLAAMGSREIAMRVDVSEFVRVNEALWWPNVVAGLFTLEQATGLFERMFEGEPPPAAVPPEWQKS